MAEIDVTSEETPGVESAASPTADTQDAQPTLADVLMRGDESGKQEESSPSEVQDSETSPAEATAEPERDPAEVAAEEEAKVPFHEHPRWKQVLRERNEYRAQVETLKTSAQAFDALRIFATERGLDGHDIEEALVSAATMRQHDLSREERVELIEAAVALKSGDMKRFAEIVAPRFAFAQQALGQLVPDDLKQKVDDGLVDPETARQQAILLAQQQLYQDSLRRQQEQMQRQRADEARRQAVAELGRWEQAQKERDPGFDKRRELRDDAAAALVARYGRPRTPAEAVQLAEAADKIARDRVAKFTPKPQPVSTPKTPPSSRGPNEPRPVPQGDLASWMMQQAAAKP